MKELTTTEELIMTAVSKQDLYGLQIAKAIDEVRNSSKKMQVGFLYPKLHSLEKKEYVKSYWGNQRPEERKGARRKYYKLTETGQDALNKIKEIRNKLASWEPKSETQAG